MRAPAFALSALTAALLLVGPAFANPRVAVVVKDREPFWTEVESGIKTEADAAQVELVVKAPFHINSVAEHLRLLTALKEQKFDALIIGPHPSTAPYKPLLSELAARGVKIVCVENIPDGIGATLVGYDQPAMAEAAVKQLGASLHSGDTIGVIRANTSGGIMPPREATLLAALKRDHPDCKIYADVMTGFEQGDDEAQTKLLLQRHPDITVVITPYTAPTLAMIRLLEQEHLGGKIRHLGFGSGFPAAVKDAIKTGTTEIYVAQLPKMLGRKSLATAVALTSGQTVPAAVSVDYFVITKANVDDSSLASANN